MIDFIEEEKFLLREGRRDDVSAVMAMIRDLAAFELVDRSSVTVTEETLLRDGFPDNNEEPSFRIIIAEDKEGMKQQQQQQQQQQCDDEGVEADAFYPIIGFALYFFAYSTWEGRMLYLEDLYVIPAYRGRSIGTAMKRQLARLCVANNLKRYRWQVLDWNERSIGFYESCGARELSPKFLTYQLTGDALVNFAANGKENID